MHGATAAATFPAGEPIEVVMGGLTPAPVLRLCSCLTAAADLLTEAEADEDVPIR